MATATIRRSLVLCAVLFAGCTANSSDYILYYLDKGFKGHPVNEFFYKYGYPTGAFEQSNGNKVYLWDSILPPQQPPTTATSTYYPPGGGYAHITDNYQGRIEQQHCVLRINTDRSDNIRGFAIEVDSIGKWSTSRCSEIFDETYP